MPHFHYITLYNYSCLHKNCHFGVYINLSGTSINPLTVPYHGRVWPSVLGSELLRTTVRFGFWVVTRKWEPLKSNKMKAFKRQNIYYISLYYISLYYISLYYISLYYISLYYISLYYISLYYISLYYISLYYISLYYISLYYISLYYISLYYISLYYISLYYISLYYISLYYISLYYIFYYNYIIFSYLILYYILYRIILSCYFIYLMDDILILYIYIVNGCFCWCVQIKNITASQDEDGLSLTSTMIQTSESSRRQRIFWLRLTSFFFERFCGT